MVKPSHLLILLPADCRFFVGGNIYYTREGKTGMCNIGSIEEMEPTTREREVQWRELQIRLAINGDKEARKRLLKEYGIKACWDPVKGQIAKLTEDGTG